MPKAVAAHIRRTVHLLEWISAEKGDALVFLGSEKLGTWGSICPRWQISRQGVELRLQTGSRSSVGGRVSISSTRNGARILLRVQNRMVPEQLDVQWDSSPEGRELPPGEFLRAVGRCIAAERPGSRIVSAIRRCERSLSLSGFCYRIHFRHQGEDCLGLALPPASDSDPSSSMLTQALLWLISLRRRKKVSGIAWIFLFVPSGCAQVLYHRSSFLNSELAAVQIWEWRENEDGEWEWHLAQPPLPPEENRDFKWPLSGPFRWSPLLNSVLDLAPDLIRRYPRLKEFDSLRILGLEFARVMGAERDRICFGIGTQHTELVEDNFDSLRNLVNEILYFRRPDSPDVRHPYYRMQSERWLESMILDDAQRIFPELASGAVHSQIPVYLGNDAGRVDILGVDREGTLVVMELKVSEDPDLPLQALDYWGRVIQHNHRGDFERRGYFGESKLNRRRPRIYLVSPVFSFHDSTERLLHFLEPDLEVWKISINVDWRSGVQVLTQRRMKCGDLSV